MSNKPNYSRRRRPVSPKTDLDRMLRAEMRAERRDAMKGQGRLGGMRRFFGWPLAIIGGIVFVVSYVGSMAGVTVLPFDSHHIVGQFGGGASAVLGVIWATSSSPNSRR